MVQLTVEVSPVCVGEQIIAQQFHEYLLGNMGNGLDKPITEKFVENARGNGVSAATASMQGWRNEMEDSHIIHIGLTTHTSSSLFAVFDGHGGTTASDYLYVVGVADGFAFNSTPPELNP